MAWWKRINRVLYKEPETWLAYLHGQQFKNLKHLQETEPRFQGGLFRLLIWVYILLRETQPVFAPHASQCKYLFFAGTWNQKKALDSTVDALRLQGEEVLAVAPAQWLTPEDKAKSRYQAICYGPLELVKSLTLLPFRFLHVCRQLNKIDPVLVKKNLETFFQPHRSLVYFDRLLESVSPGYVIVSNDHNADNRALLALARQRGIKTVYMQHASVSELFPALNFDYSFLDGQGGVEVYRQCELSHPPEDPPSAKRVVFLSGQKKCVTSDHRYHEKYVGLALNALDKIEDTIKLLYHLCDIQIPVKVRWHPSLSERGVNKLQERLKQYPVKYSDPDRESISTFLASSQCLIAGNSSIHLEAALCGVVPIYYESTPPDAADYYGYVKHGLAMSAKDLETLIQCVDDVAEGRIHLNPASVQYYSATFGTEWEGREGELVAKTLIALDGDMPLPVSAVIL